MKQTGKVYLVGAGPGDPELLTVRAHGLIRTAEVILHDDLVSEAILSLAGPLAEVVNVGKRCGIKKVTQQEINARMIQSAREGKNVVRLKSGDPGIFGRLAEEMEALDEAGIRYEVVPGVTAAIAAAASLDVSLTDRRSSARVVIVTGHKAHAGAAAQTLDWKSLAREDATLIVYMPGNEFERMREELLEAGVRADLPALIVSRATCPGQRHQFTTVGQLAALPHFEAPSVLLIGRALAGGEKARSSRVSRAVEYAELLLASE